MKRVTVRSLLVMFGSCGRPAATMEATAPSPTALPRTPSYGAAAAPERSVPECVRSMLEEADRLTRLVESLLHLARAEGGRIVLARERVDLRELADEGATLLAVLAEERSQRVRVEGDGGALVQGDRAVLRQALLNVLDNAIKYGPVGSEVRVVVTRGARDVELAVVDAGPGIAPEHAARVFERFYRVDAARARGGFGLGLAIAQWAVEAHGGHIALESQLGRGCTFRIRLPADEAAGRT
jgi:signal transduction histidine kinase